jgi:hypothetical protein
MLAAPVMFARSCSPDQTRATVAQAAALVGKLHRLDAAGSGSRVRIARRDCKPRRLQRHLIVDTPDDSRVDREIASQLQAIVLP